MSTGLTAPAGTSHELMNDPTPIPQSDDRRGALLRRAALVDRHRPGGGSGGRRGHRPRRPPDPRPAPPRARPRPTTSPVSTASPATSSRSRPTSPSSLERAPEVIILGGSRSLRFEPAYIEQVTGHSAFNAGVRNGRPEEAWGLTHYLHDLFPDTRPRYLWLIHVNLLRAWERVSPPLVLDDRFCRYFPEDFLAEQAPLMPGTAPRTIRPAAEGGPRFAADGHLEWSRADEIPAGDRRASHDRPVAGPQRPRTGRPSKSARPSGSRRRSPT